MSNAHCDRCGHPIDDCIAGWGASGGSGCTGDWPGVEALQAWRRRALEAERAAGVPPVAAARLGYMTGHHDTVEGVYGDPDETASELIEELDRERESGSIKPLRALVTDINVNAYEHGSYETMVKVELMVPGKPRMLSTQLASLIRQKLEAL